MLKASFEFDSQGRLLSFALKGHAGTAVKGENIICAAASAIAQTAIGSLDELTQQKADYKAEDGLISCQVSYKGIDDLEANTIATLMQSVRIGCMQLEASYGSEYISCYDKNK